MIFCSVYRNGKILQYITFIVRQVERDASVVVSISDALQGFGCHYQDPVSGHGIGFIILERSEVYSAAALSNLSKHKNA